MTKPWEYIPGMIRSMISSKHSRLLSVKSKRADLDIIANWILNGDIKFPIAKHQSVQQLSDALHYKITHLGVGAIVMDVLNNWPTPARLSANPIDTSEGVAATTAVETDVGKGGATKQEGANIAGGRDEAQPAEITPSSDPDMKIEVDQEGPADSGDEHLTASEDEETAAEHVDVQNGGGDMVDVVKVKVTKEAKDDKNMAGESEKDAIAQW
jgi:hypothetical protein